MTVEHTLHFDGDPSGAIAGGGSVWVLTAEPEPDPPHRSFNGTFLGPPSPLATGASALEFGADSLWVDDPNTKSVLRLSPAMPPPAARPAGVARDVLRNGPVPKNVRLRVKESVTPDFSIQGKYAAAGSMCQAMGGRGAEGD